MNDNKVKVWLARDKSGRLYIHPTRPRKLIQSWCSDFGYESECSVNYFPSVRWEDDEPTEAYITLANEPQQKKEIDWEQRRYELAKDLLLKKYLEVSQFSLKREDDIRLVIGYADKIINELKKQSDEL